MRKRNISCSDKPLRRLGASQGQSIIEFALMVPILAVVLIGILDLGRVYYAYIAVVNSGREGARYGAAHPPRFCADSNSTGVQAIVRHTRDEASSSGGLNPAQLTVNVLCPTGLNAFGEPIMVETRYSFQMVTASLLGAGPIGLYSSAQMKIFSQTPE